MKLIEPTLPFSQLKNKRHKVTHQAIDLIESLTEEQCRYALWATLVILFGRPDCDATEVMMKHETAIHLEMDEARVLLAQLGIGKCCAREVAAMVAQLQRRREKEKGGVDAS